LRASRSEKGRASLVRVNNPLFIIVDMLILFEWNLFSGTTDFAINRRLPLPTESMLRSTVSIHSHSAPYVSGL
jgi:hypothetical protein